MAKPASKIETHGCGCGAIQVTVTAYKLMSEPDRRMLDGQIKSCQVCKQRRLGVPNGQQS